MKVKTLIEMLQKHDPNNDVQIGTEHDIGVIITDDIFEHLECDGKTVLIMTD